MDDNHTKYEMFRAYQLRYCLMCPTVLFWGGVFEQPWILEALPQQEEKRAVKNQD